MRDLAVVVLPIETETDSGRVVPRLGGGAEVVSADAGWCDVFVDGRVARRMLSACLGAVDGAQGAFVVFGPRALVDRAVAASSSAWADLRALRADGGAVATRIKNAWQAGAGQSLQTRLAGFGDDDGEGT